MNRAIGLVVWAFMCGCATAASDAGSAGGVKGCVSDRDCNEGVCVDGFCSATENRIQALLLEATVPSTLSSGDYANLRFLFPATLGAGGHLDVAVGLISRLEVKISPPALECENAPIDADGRVPLRVSVIQDPRLAGILPQSYGADSDTASQDFSVAVAVPPGEVDLYFEPIEGNALVNSSLTACRMPPLLVRGQLVEAGRVLIEQRLPLPQVLTVDVRFPRAAADDGETSPLLGWTLDVVEPVGGRRISTRADLLADDSDDPESFHHVVEVAFNPVSGKGAEAILGTELVRLSPPEGVVAPTFTVSRSALDLFGTGQNVLDQISRLPPVIVVEGRVEGEDDSTPFRADVSVLAEELDAGPSGVFATFRTLGHTDLNGSFSIPVVAGRHRVVAVPVSDASRAVGVTQWVIADSPSTQAGKLVELPEASTLRGAVRDAAAGVDLVGSTVTVLPSRTERSATYLGEVLGDPVVAALRSGTAVVDEGGAFSVQLDQGTFDVSLRPPENRLVPWAVRSRVEVGKGTTDLGQISMPLSVVYDGTVTVPGSSDAGGTMVLPGVLLRAYAVLDATGALATAPEEGVGVVSIGQARADSNGSFLLVLPDRLE